MKRMMAIVAGITAVVVGCGGASVPASTVMQTQASLKAAERVGAEQTPQAALYLDFAREQVARAEQLSDEGEGGRAAMMLVRAKADAELAMALAREADMQRRVQDTLERIEALEAANVGTGGEQ